MERFRRLVGWVFVLLLVLGYLACFMSSCVEEDKGERGYGLLRFRS